MKIIENEVRTKDAGPWIASLYLVESPEEAVEVYGKEGTTMLINSSLAVKQQNIERDIFSGAAADADMVAVRKEAEQKAKDYRPGSTAKTSNKMKAYELLKQNMDRINSDKDLDEKVSGFLLKNDFKGIIAILSGEADIVDETALEPGTEE
ncbi:MAG TPA: hypothetical protein DD713_03320 [Nitrospiraceae bacterium]|nr:hypothetical protein [Nitrospiraceae bacterium]